jgi:hypothetical protein
MGERESFGAWLGRRTHRVLERLTAAKTHLWILRRQVRTGAVDPEAAQAHIDQADRQIEDAAAAVEELRQQTERVPESG